MYPTTFDDVLAFQVRETVWELEVPVPVRVCLVGELDALLVKDKVAEAAPEAVGAKVTVNDAVPLAAMVTGNVIPESVNSLLLMVNELTVTGAEDAVRVPPSALLEPTATLPNASVVGDTARVPGAVPVPESAMFSGEFVAFETMARVPLAEPAEVGANFTVKVTLPLAVSVTGSVRPVTVKAAPVTLAAVIASDEPPVLVSVSDRLVLFPTCTLPNERLDGFAESVPGVVPVPDNGMLRLGFDPSEVILRLPVTLPLAVGANCTEKVLV